MKANPKIRAWGMPKVVAGAVAGVAMLSVVAFLAYGQADDQKDKDPEAKEAAKARPGVITTQTLGGDERFLTYISTDKPLYKPGETVYVRGAVLDHRSHEPFDKKDIGATIEVLGPKGDVVAGGTSIPEDGVMGFKWEVPPATAGGEYTLKVSWPALGYTPAERKFDIRAYRAPRLKSQIKFIRDGYGPGDEVVATLETERAEGGVPAGAKVTVIARVDGGEVYRGNTEVSEAGEATARFALPAEIRRGEGTLALVIEDGGVVETASKTIPILLQTVDLQFYPEGGDLVAGVANRVYFEGRTPAKKPADIAGVVVDKEGKEVAEFKSEHDGRGRIGFTPEAGGKYSLKITQPSGINNLFPLPAVKAEGVTISTAKNVYQADEPVALTVSATKPMDGLQVTLMQRETELASEAVKFDGNAAEIQLKSKGADGVLIATVWDKNNKPLAERLVFVQPEKSINVEISADAKQYVPGGQAKLKVKTNDEGRVTGVTLKSEATGETTDVGCQVLVDATGQSAAVASRFGSRDEDPKLKKAAIWGYYKNATRGEGLDEGATVILHTKSKKCWFWFIPLKDQITSIGLVGDHAELLKSGVSPEQKYEDELVNCPSLAKRLTDAEMVDKFRVAKEFSYTTRQRSGDGWVLVGDAYGFIDPVYSSGVYFALKTGEMAADAIAEGLSSGDTSGEQLAKWVPEFDSGAAWIRKLVGAFYANEFSFGEFMRMYPQHASNLTDILIGRVYYDGAGKIFEDMEPAIAAAKEKAKLAMTGEMN